MRAPDAVLRGSVVWLHDIRSLHNVGSVFRTADGFGIAEVWLSGFTPTPPRPEIHKTALGADQTVTWRQFPSAEEVLACIRQENRYLVAIEQTTDAADLRSFTPPQQAIVVAFGNEVLGIDDRILHAADAVVEIPQFGRKHSLNVSVAAGVVLFGLMRRSD
jgi:tRNA G18 (ribose-2'-O)-methylase SpoU